MKRALVLGADGFIGSHMVKSLKDEGYWIPVEDICNLLISFSNRRETRIRDLPKITRYKTCIISMLRRLGVQKKDDEI